MAQSPAKGARRPGQAHRRRQKPAKPIDTAPDSEKSAVDAHLDEGLEETFPASDPVSISPGAD